MPSYVTPKKNTAYIGSVTLVDQALPNKFKLNPTLAAGDVKVSIDGGALNNLTTLPVVTPAGSGIVKFSLSAAEMNGDRIDIYFADAAGDEWADAFIPISTTLNQIDDLSTFDPTTDAVANVTLVATCTSNSDMVASPDNAGITANGVAIGALNDLAITDILNTQMTESYASNGAAPTLSQAIYLIQQSIGDFAIAGTTISVKKLDGSTTGASYNLDDGTNPTLRTRVS